MKREICKERECVREDGKRAAESECRVMREKLKCVCPINRKSVEEERAGEKIRETKKEITGANLFPKLKIRNGQKHFS